MTKKRNKKYTPRESTAQKSLKDVIYKLNKNCLKMGDMYSIMICIQHLFWIQVINRDHEYRFVNMSYLNSVKRSLIKLLTIIKENTTEKDGTYYADTEQIINLHYKTRQKILWFYIKIYEPTLQFWNLLDPIKMAKIKTRSKTTIRFFCVVALPNG